MNNFPFGRTMFIVCCLKIALVGGKYVYACRLQVHNNTTITEWGIGQQRPGSPFQCFDATLAALSSSG